MKETRKLFEVIFDGTKYFVLASQLSTAIQEVLSWHSQDIDDESLSCNLIDGDTEKIYNEDDGETYELNDWIKENITISDNPVIVCSCEHY